MGGVGGKEEEWKPSSVGDPAEVSSGSQPGRTRTLQTSQRLSFPLPASQTPRFQHKPDSVAVRVRSRADAFDSVATVGWTVHVHSTSEFRVKKPKNTPIRVFRRPDVQRFHERTVGIPLIQPLRSVNSNRPEQSETATHSGWRDNPTGSQIQC